MKKFKTTNGVEVIVSNGDYQNVIQLKPWYAKPTGYVYRRKNGKSLYLHRFLLKAKTGEIVDHKDRNPRHNQRSNLRITTTSNNRANSKKRLRKDGTCCSVYKGVTRKKGRKKNPWQVYICKDGKQM